MNNAIHTAARRLSQTVQDLGLAVPFQPAHPEVLNNIQQQLDLPSEMIAWYTVAEPVNFEIPSFGNHPILLSAKALPDTQTEYRPNGATGKTAQSWDPSWIVFGGEGRYPLIVRTASMHDSAIYYGEVQKRVWRITPLSSNLVDFLLGINDYVRLYVVDYHGSIHNEDGVLVTTFWNDFAALLDQYPGTAGRTEAWLSGWLGY